MSLPTSHYVLGASISGGDSRSFPTSPSHRYGEGVSLSPRRLYKGSLSTLSAAPMRRRSRSAEACGSSSQPSRRAPSSTPEGPQQRFSAQHAAALPPGGIPHAPSLPPSAMATPSTSVRGGDYFNVAPQRGFFGRFRCAATVLVRTTPRSAASAAPATPPAQRSPLGGEGVNESPCPSGPALHHAGISTAPHPVVASTSSLEGSTAAPVEVASLALTHPPRNRAGSLASSSHVSNVSQLPRQPAFLHPFDLPPSPSAPSSKRALSLLNGTTTSRAAQRRGQRSSSVKTTQRREVPTTAASSSPLQSMEHQSPKDQLRGMKALAGRGLRQTLWLAAYDGTVEVRAVSCPSQLLAVVAKKKPNVIVTSMAQVSGNRVVVGQSDGLLRMFDAASLAELMERRGHTAAVTCLLWIDSVAAGSDAAHHWSNSPVPHPAKTATPVVQGYPVVSALLTGSVDTSIGVWDVNTMTCLHRLQSSLSGICTLAATQTGGYAFSGSEDGAVRLWDVVYGAQWQLTSDAEQRLHGPSDEEERRHDAVASGGSPSKRGPSPACTPPTITTNTSKSPGVLTETAVVVPLLPLSMAKAASRSYQSRAPDDGRLTSRRPKTARSAKKKKKRKTPRQSSTRGGGGDDDDNNRAGVDHDERLSSPLTRFSCSDFGELGSPLPDDRDMRLVGRSRAVHPSPDGSLLLSLPRTPRTARQKAKKAHKSCGSSPKGLLTPALPGSGKTPRTARDTPAKKKKKMMKTPRQLEMKEPFFQRPGPILTAYRQRVHFTKSSQELVALHAAAYDDAFSFHWPITDAHAEHVTSIVVVEDRLLVSASRDATAKVFALPSGQFMQALHTPRRIPLAALLYDAVLRRLYTTFSDGGVAVYQMDCTEMPLHAQLPTPANALSFSFFPLAAATLRRFYLLKGSAGAKGEEEVVVSVVQYDAATPAHGPSQTTSSYCVGEPSLRELNVSTSLTTLQRQRLASFNDLESRRNPEALQERELDYLRRCGEAVKRSYTFRLYLRIWSLWQRWSRRHRAVRRLAIVATSFASSAAQHLCQRYWVLWTGFRQQCQQSSMEQRRQAIERITTPTATVGAHEGVRDGRQSALVQSIIFLEKWQRLRQVQRFFAVWRTWQLRRRMALRQATSFNRLLLSMNAGTYAPQAVVETYLLRRAVNLAYREKALWIATRQTREVVEGRIRRCFYDRWRAFARSSQTRVQANGWRLVEPLVSRLIQPQELRRRYFDCWRSFTLYVAKDARLAGENDILQREWQTLRDTITGTSTIADLKAKKHDLEKAIPELQQKRRACEEEVNIVAEEEAAQRSADALRVMMAGYDVPVLRGTSSQRFPSTTASPSPMQSRGGSRQRSRSLLPLYSRIDPLCTSTPRNWEMESSIGAASLRSDELILGEEKLLRDVSAVLRALKANAIHHLRDEKHLLSAHALALRLPVLESPPDPLPRDDHSEGVSKRVTAPLHPQLQLGLPPWGESSPRKTSNAGLPRGRRTAPPSGSASVTPSSAVTRGNGSSSVTAPQVMWASQPAEVSYACLADAFNDVYQHLLDQLYRAAHEAGVDRARVIQVLDFSVDGGAGPPTSNEADEESGCLYSVDTAVPVVSGVQNSCVSPLQAATTPPSDATCSPRPSQWLSQIPLKARRSMVGELVKLVVFFDSFATHSDLTMESAGSLSVRGSGSTRPLGLESLCSRETAQSLLQHAAVLLEFADGRLWERQVQLGVLQEAYATAMAELNREIATSAAHAETYSSIGTTCSESEDARRASLCHAPVVVLPRLDLSDDTPHTLTLEGLQKSYLPPDATARLVDTAPLLLPSSLATFTTTERKHDRISNLDASTLEGSTASGEEGGAQVPELRHLRVHSFSHRTTSGVSTPRSYTSRTAGSFTPGVSKPYLGFRVSVSRDTQPTLRSSLTVIISIREVTDLYVNSEGEEMQGPAAAAGMLVGDRLVRFAGYAVTDLAAFNAIVSRHVHIGASLPVVILRDGKQLSKTLVVGCRI